MKDVKSMDYFPTAESLVDVLMKRTQSKDPLFFRVLVAYYFSKVASMMRTNIKTFDRGSIPVSLYALNLANSGHGKGYSTNIVEEQVIHKFKHNFLEVTFPMQATKNLKALALKRAHKYDVEPEDMEEKVAKEFEDLGPLVFSFDSGTTPALKQMRHKLLMAGAGSMNFELDEVGSNLLSNTDLLNTYLELFDVGKVKQKLTKVTADNRRNEEIDGRTPTNMMLFGTPSKLLDGSKREEEFYSMLETGYARRCLFGYSKGNQHNTDLTPQEVFDMMTDTSSKTFLTKLAVKLGNLADMVNFNTDILISKDVTLLMLEYKGNCEKLATKMLEHQEIHKAEMSHRYYKALKLAGTYAFIDGSAEITEDHLYNAIKLVEESGEAFTQILTRERNYIKLAKYIVNAGREVTQVDLVEDLPFYRGGDNQKRELMALATAYGYKNNMIIKSSRIDGIEFLEGESMEVTNLESVMISYSKHFSEGYKADNAKFDDLHKLTTMKDYHYTAHAFLDGYRDNDHALPGFNLAIIDIDGGVTLESAKELLKDYKCLFSTTKRHTPELNRFRIIMPLSHIVKLTVDTYSEFMKNLYAWLPFPTDDSTFDIARKWEAFPGHYEYNDGKLLDATLFIPQTRKQEELNKRIMDQGSLSNLERWFMNNTDTGNRSNQLIKFALVLVDNNLDIDDVRERVLGFNAQLDDPLQEIEIEKTIMVTVTKAVTKRDN